MDQLVRRKFGTLIVSYPPACKLPEDDYLDTVDALSKPSASRSYIHYTSRVGLAQVAIVSMCVAVFATCHVFFLWSSIINGSIALV
jgi:hypothetical protein